ncbi:hypothetical protein [Streptomyces sp. NPDC012756]|uniref:SCO2400 family protein n=1 Tax=Streptomyces sp. NPDC012756 TaxID=3364847 RepID=UPI0036A5C78F
MDYCHTCRRHLNGALACAGCGTPVEELRYETPHIPVHTPDHPQVPTPDLGYGYPNGPAAYGTQAGPAAYGAQAGPAIYGDHGGPGVYGDHGGPGVYGDHARPAAYGDQSGPGVYGDHGGPGVYGDPSRSAAYGGATPPAHDEPSPDDDDDGGGAGDDDLDRPAPEHVYELDVLEPPRTTPGGRRAARGRPAARRGRKQGPRRGRTVLVGTVGLVLAAGTLTLAKIAFEEPPQDGAATAVEELEVTETPLSPPPVETTEPSQGSSPSRGTDAPSSVPARPRQVSTGSDSGPGSGSGSGTGTGTGTGSGTGTGTGSGTAPTAAPTTTAPASPSATPTATASATESGPTPTGSATPGGPTASTTGPTPSRTPTPSPTPTCTRFLWWCV